MQATWLMNRRAAAEAHYAKMTNWHPVFAWWPTWVAEGDCRWMEVIERKCEYIGAYDGTYRFDSFRAPHPTETEGTP